MSSLLVWVLLGWGMVSADVPSPPFALRWEPGVLCVYRFTDEQSVVDQAPKVPAIESETISYLSLRPQEWTPTGGKLLAQYDRVQVKLTQGTATDSFDTANRPARKESSTWGMYRTWIGRGFVVEVDSRGAVVHLEPAVESKESATAAAAAHLRRHLLVLWSWMPKEAIDTDGRWHRREELKTGLVDLVRESTLRVARTQGSVISVEGVLRLSGQPTRAIGPGGETVLATVPASEPGRASILFDASAGQVKQIESSIVFRMNLTRLSPEQDGNPSTAVEQSQKLHARSRVELITPSSKTAARTGSAN